MDFSINEGLLDLYRQEETAKVRAAGSLDLWLAKRTVLVWRAFVNLLKDGEKYEIALEVISPNVHPPFERQEMEQETGLDHLAGTWA
jgi:hypothetical protein